MKKIIVTSEFRDRDNFAVVYKRGEAYEFEDERAASIVGRGLGAYPKEEEEKPARKTVKKNDK